MAGAPILYIEDNYHNRRLVRKILASRGYEVLEAEDGRTGLRMLRELHPPLLLLDIGLPDIDGLEVVARIRADAELAATPVIAITASAMRGDRERFLTRGCDDYLSKPLQALELIALVERYYPPDEKDPPDGPHGPARRAPDAAPPPESPGPTGS